MHVIAAKAVAFGEALRPEFKLYAAPVIENARALADSLQGAGFKIVSGGTDSHLMLVDLTPKGVSGADAEKRWSAPASPPTRTRSPNDPLPAMQTSGLRVGSPAGTTRGFGPGEFRQVGQWIGEVLDGVAARRRQFRGRGEGRGRGAGADAALPDLQQIAFCRPQRGYIMRCPFCGHAESQVKDSRPSEDGAAIRRRRLCPECGGRFTTFERVQLRELTILKRSGRRTPFERDKLARSISIAIRKRPIDPERVERMISSIMRQLESMGETELPSSAVGELVMKQLKALDDVAYVRYASVYRDFRETQDFAQFLGEEGLAEAAEAEH